MSEKVTEFEITEESTVESIEILFLYEDDSDFYDLIDAKPGKYKLVRENE